MDSIPRKRVLDLGCGNGALTEMIARRHAKVIGIDRSTALIRLAQKKQGDIGYLVASMTELPFGARSFDIVFSSMSFLCLNQTDLHKTYQEAHRVLAKTGVLIVASVHPVSRIANTNPALVTYPTKNDFDYFRSQQTDARIRSVAGREVMLHYFHHSLSTMVNFATRNGFILERIIEPKPTKRQIKKFGALLSTEKTQPSYIVYIFRKR